MDLNALELLINNIRVGIRDFNLKLDIYVPALVVVFLLWTLTKYIRNKIKSDGFQKGIYYGSLAIFETSIVIIGLFTIYWITQWTAIVFLGQLLESSTIYWGLIYFLLIPFWHLVTRKNSNWRGTFSVFITLTVFLIGWLYNYWIGILFISIPITLLFAHLISSFAQVILPVNDPDDENEKHQKTLVFSKYLLGIQYPIWVAKTKTERILEKRIEGNNILGFGKPGVIYTWPHQVTGLSKGVQFNRVGSPGITFTEHLENPIELIDLRTQLRVCDIKAVTKDGLEVQAVLFTAFTINRDNLPKRFIAEMKHATGRDFSIDHPDGRYAYSSGRIHWLLSSSGINTNPNNDGQKPEFHWDEWVMKQIEHAAREVISDRSVDELWRPRDDSLRSSALDEIADELNKSLAQTMTDSGINLFTVRVVNYKIEDNSPTVQQNIKIWSSYWRQKITEANTDVEMIYRDAIENAHTYAKSILLSAVTESIKEAREINPKLSKYVIAQYYIHALEEYLKEQPGLNKDESKKRLENIKDLLFYRMEEDE